MMESKLHTTAILLFTNSSTEELRHKNIANGSQLFDALTQHALHTVKRTGHPFFHLSEDQQTGYSFGERFTNAIQFVFDKGFERIITVGNDSPHLTKTHLDVALANLETNKSVVGPSADGGFYLMGLHRSEFQKAAFEKLSWQSSKLKEEIVGILSKSGKEIVLLQTLFDIDTFWDLKQISKYTRGLSQKILLLVRSITYSDPQNSIYTTSYQKELYSSAYYNKGSPIRTIS